MKTHQESTYALLVRSEEKSRNALETVAYLTFILSVVVAFWQFAQNPVNIPVIGSDPGIASQIASTTSPS